MAGTSTNLDRNLVPKDHFQLGLSYWTFLRHSHPSLPWFPHPLREEIIIKRDGRGSPAGAHPSPALLSGRIDYSSVFRNTRRAHSWRRTDSERGAMDTGKTESDGQSLHLVFIGKEIKLWRKIVLLAPDLRINICSAFLARQEGGGRG